MELATEGKTTDIRTIFKTKEFEKFYDDLNDKVKNKFEYTFELVQTVYALPTKYVKHLEGTELYEMRISVGSNEYRTVLFAIDNSNVIQSTKIILLNGFLKKSTKDYDKQIDRAIQILKSLAL
ncbi:type II toxin-antitoxin system RelE/ParE family toxin [Bacteroides ihuae]|uniref:type II toxin-antitoxin system RelE/ParE family toxin n=1 Tax=Bacteroides ihuae TaxID=1852362 RepID=UPI0008D94CAB|nr:type II toxin-antitoxin system RelE/ParE family toxin [Bacteroides ihuae]